MASAKKEAVRPRPKKMRDRKKKQPMKRTEARQPSVGTPKKLKGDYQRGQEALRYRIKMEGELERYREHFEELVKERTTKLTRVNKQLRRQITERKRAEEALRESEEKYRELADFLPQTVFELDQIGNFTFANRYGFKSFGYSREDFDKGLNALQMFIPEDHDRIKENIQKRLRGEELGANEYTALRKDGSTFPVLVYAAPIIGGNKSVGLRGVVVDITERKQAEEAIQQQYKFLRNLLDSLVHPFYVIDASDYTIKLANTAAQLGSLSENPTCYLLTHKSSQPCLGTAHVCPLEEVKKTKTPVVVEHIHYDKEGNARNVEVHAHPIFDTKGDVIQMIEYCFDITERKKMEENLQHSQLLASLGEMTAGIAHEVNNPLGSILLYSELLMASGVSRQTKKDLKIMHDEAKRAARIMTDLLAYGHGTKFQMRRLNLHSVLNRVLTMRRYQQRVQNISVSTNLVNGPLYIMGSSSQLMQVFINLMLNAEEALGESKGGNIIVTTQIDGEWARVLVADDGTGIPPENLTQVFYPFFTTKQMGEGTGLGLSAGYGIVTAHNGLIHAENNEVGGATFTVELPLVKSRGRKGLTRRKMIDLVRKRAGIIRVRR